MVNNLAMTQEEQEKVAFGAEVGQPAARRSQACAHW